MNLVVKPIPINSETALTLVDELERELRKDYPPHYIHELDVKSFEEQQGIINAYVKREREWKALKIEQHNKIEALSKEIEKLNSELNDEQ